MDRGPSKRTPVAAARKTDRLLCVLFEDATVGLKLSDHSLDDSGYQLVYHNPLNVTNIVHWPGSTREFPRYLLILLLILPYTILYLSVRSYLPIGDIPLEMVWIAVAIPFLMYFPSHWLFLKAEEIHIHHSTNIDPYVISFHSKNKEESDFFLNFALLLAVASVVLFEVDTQNAIACDLILLALLVIFNSENIFTIPLTSLFSKSDILVPLLTSGEFRDRLKHEIREKKEEVMRSRSLEDLVIDGENERIEFKSSFWTESGSGEKSLLLQDAVVKEVAGLLNSDFGGTLLIGVGDEEPFDPTGLVEKDIAHIGSEDKLELHIGNILSRDLLTDFSAGLWTIRFRPFRGEKIIMINVPKQAPKPVLAYQPNEQKKKQKNAKEEYRFTRSGSATNPISSSTWTSYVLEHWGKSGE